MALHESQFQPERRDFLKSCAGGAIGVIAAGTIGSKAHAGSSAWTDKKVINPEIDNLRVVCCHDPDMVTGVPTGSSMEAQNAPVVKETVQANLDAMAMSLAQKDTPLEAWRTIFRKPETKDWSAVKAAVKVNCISENHPRLAIVDKVCQALHSVGVTYENIFIYDGCHNAYQHYSSYVGSELPAGIQVSTRNSLLGDSIMASIPPPYTLYTQSLCTAHIADGTIDILVNCAVNKGHSVGSKVTMCLKNHFGTFVPHVPNGLGSDPHGNIDYIFSINKSDAIIGGEPPRQQLCIIDSLWASVSGPSGMPDKETHRLCMGVFAPATDYLTVKEIREDIMGATHDSNISRFMTEFGYEESDAGSLIAVNPASTYGRSARHTSRNEISISVTSGRFPSQKAVIAFPADDKLSGIAIIDMRGRTVRTLDCGGISRAATSMDWDGRDNAGRFVAPGKYSIKLRGSATQRGAGINVM
jgi:hypothetical protein